MEQILYGNLLKNISLIASTVGIVIGLDLLLGARITKMADRASKVLFDIDKSIDNASGRIGLGIAFLALSLIIFLLLKKAF